MYQSPSNYPSNIGSPLKKSNSLYYFEKIKEFHKKKTNLFLSLTICICTIFSYLLLLPNILQSSMTYHIIIHIISLDLAVFLTAVSFIAYRRARSKKLLLTSLSFVFLIFIEISYLLQASRLVDVFYVTLIEADVSHILLLCMLVLFAYGVLKIDRN